MKKKWIRGFCLLLVCLLFMGRRAAAALRNTVFLSETGSGAVVSVRLEERQDEILSVGLSLQISFPDGDGSEAQVTFSFDSAIQSKVMEYRYNAAKGTLNLYLSGRENLFPDKELTLGTVTVTAPEGDALTVRIAVVENSLQLVNAAYDNENTGEISAPEAPEFTIGGELPDDNENVMPPETDGGDNGQTPGGSDGDGQGTGGSTGGGHSSGGAGSGADENPTAGSSQPPTQETVGSAQGNTAAATTAAVTTTETAESETASDAENGGTAEETDITEAAASQEDPAESSAAGTDGFHWGQDKAQDKIWQMLLIGGLAVIGVFGLIMFCVWLDQRSRARRRHRQRAKSRTDARTGRRTESGAHRPPASHENPSRDSGSAPKEHRPRHHHTSLSERDAAARHAAAEKAKENLRRRPHQGPEDEGRR